MGKLIAVPAPSDIPCHMHNCYNPIAYRLVHPNYVETLGMELALICADCARSLMDSLQSDDVDQDTEAFDDVADTFMGQDAVVKKRGRPKKNDVRAVRT